MVGAAVVLAAAREAGDPMPRCPDTIMTFSANRATESVAPSHDTTAERELMGAGLVRYPKIAAGNSPLGTMWRQSAATNATMTVVG